MEFSGGRAFDLLQAQVDLGIRAPGSPGHAAVQAWLAQQLRALGLAVDEQRFSVPLTLAPAGAVELCNLRVRIPGRSPGPCTLLATHYDSRWIADREPDPARRGEPILGANDGGSGTAVQLELARRFCESPPLHDVILAFCDGEDLGDIEGHPFALGSRRLVSDPGPFWPDQVIALDMVGGEGMRLNLELNSLSASPASRRLFVRLFALGQALHLEPFSGGDPRWIWSDHGPWLEAEVPAALLIDIDYPQWHTLSDLPEHCSAASLAAVGQVLERYLCGPRS